MTNNDPGNCSPQDWRCPVCRRVYSPGKPCSDCQRHQAIGVLVKMLIGFQPGPDGTRRTPNLIPSPGELLALDAIAVLLGSVTRLRRRHNRELREEQRGAQQDARAAYAEGRADGRGDGDGW